MNNKGQSDLEILIKAFSNLKNIDDWNNFLLDLCTPAELKAMSLRLKVAVMINSKIPYRQIQHETGVSTATITRVARYLENGQGGYKKVLKGMLS